MNLVRIIEEHPDDAVALVSRGQRSTYGELRATVAGLRTGLVDLGLVRGERVGIIGANNPLFVTSYLAILGAGLVAVPLNPTSPPAELIRELNAVGASAVVVGPTAAAAFAPIDRDELPGLRHVIAPTGVEAGPGTLDLAELGDSERDAPVVEVGHDDLAVLIFTAGTAGSPKAAMLTHASLRANIDQVQMLPDRSVRASDVSFGVLPLFHIFGLNVVLGLSLAAGASVVLVERFDPLTALDTITNHGCTIVAGAPPMWAAWAGLPGVAADAFSGVRLAVSGASKLDEAVAEKMEERFGVVIDEGYGLTEASPVVTSSAGTDARRGSIGRPLPGMEIRLVDSEGDDALLGDAGEIWARGPNIFKGYWEDPVATASAITPDGWLRTGDIAVADDDGHLTIVDRAKDLIIVSGFNVYPAEVESVLAEHPGVVAAAVVGVEHPHSGEAVKAFVVSTPGHHVEEGEVIDFVATRLARYKCPTKVLFVDALPQGLGGKVLRRALR